MKAKNKIKIFLYVYYILVIASIILIIKEYDKQDYSTITPYIATIISLTATKIAIIHQNKKK